jgi:hypothetical protein
MAGEKRFGRDNPKVEEVKQQLIKAYHNHKSAWIYKDKEGLLKAIQQASQYLEHAAMSYEQWVDLKTHLDVIEDYFCKREPPDDKELMKRFQFAMKWYGPEHWRVQAYFDQYRDRPQFLEHAKIVRNGEKAKVTNG